VTDHEIVDGQLVSRSPALRLERWDDPADPGHGIELWKGGPPTAPIYVVLHTGKLCQNPTGSKLEARKMFDNLRETCVRMTERDRHYRPKCGFEPCPDGWVKWMVGGSMAVYGQPLPTVEGEASDRWVQIQNPDDPEPPYVGKPALVALMQGGGEGFDAAWQFETIAAAVEAVGLARATGWPDVNPLLGTPIDPGSVGIECTTLERD